VRWVAGRGGGAGGGGGGGGGPGRSGACGGVGAARARLLRRRVRRRREGGWRDCRLRRARAAPCHRPAHPQTSTGRRCRARLGRCSWWCPWWSSALMVLGVERGHRHHNRM